MIVMKFGGTSIQDPECIRRVVKIVRSRLPLQPVVVNSAMGKTTRGLLKIAQWAAGGDAQQAGLELEALVAYHQKIIRTCLPGFSEHPFQEKLNRFFQELAYLKDGVAVLRDLTPRSQDKFLAYGELIATMIITGALQSEGIDAVWCDARELIVTDDRFTQAQPIRGLTDSRLRERILPLVEAGKVPVIQGYIGATREEATTTLGFEGSDFTAALIGAALDVGDVQIWKDVPGVMTADPDLFPGALTVKSISFEEAAEISFFGAKVLHPKSIAPAQEKAIPVHVLNSRNPANTGTELSVEGAVSRLPVKSITYKRPVVLLILKNRHQLPFYDFFKMIFDVLDRERLTPYLVTIAERTVKMVLSTSANLQHLMDDLNQVAQIDIVANKATVSVIGQSLVEHVGIAERIVNCFQEIPLDMILHGASNMNTTLVLSADKVETAVDRLHHEFFQNIDNDIFETTGQGVIES